MDFSQLDWGYGFLKRRSTDVPWRSYHIISRVHSMNMTSLCHWPGSSGSSTACQVSTVQSYSFFLLSTCSLWKEVTLCSPHLRHGGVSLISLRANKLLEFFCTEHLPLLPNLFIYSIIYLYQYLSWILILCFRLWSNTTSLCCLNISALATGSSFSWLLCSLDILPSMCVFFGFWFCFALFYCGFLSTSLLSGTIRLFGLILHVSCPVLEWAFLFFLFIYLFIF